MEGLQLASAGDDIKLWDCGNGFSLLHQLNPHGQNVSSLSWNFEGDLLASCAPKNDKVALTYLKNGILTTIEFNCGHGVQCTDFSSNSCFLLCGGVGGVNIWDLKTKTLKKSFKDAKRSITTARYNWNDSYIAAGSEAGEIILHNVVTGQSSSPLVTRSAQAIRQLEYSAFKKSMFVTVSDDGAVTLWDANTRRQLHSFQDAHLGPATGVSFSPINGMLMMSVGLDKRVICYDIHKKNILKTFDAQSPLTCINIMPDGATAVVGSTRGKIYIYDLRQGGSTPVHAFQAHKTSVHSVRFMPVPKLKGEEGGVSQTSISSVSSARRQLPSAPLVVQDITSNSKVQKTTSDSVISSYRRTPELRGQGMDIFSPTTEGLQSCQSLSASHVNLSLSRGENSYSGLFSPLTDGVIEGSTSHSVKASNSFLSSPSFLGQRSVNFHSPLSVHHSYHMSNGLNSFTHHSLNHNTSGRTDCNSSAIVPQTSNQLLNHPVSSSGLPESGVNTSSTFLTQQPIPPLQLSQDSALLSGGEEDDVGMDKNTDKNCVPGQSSASNQPSQCASPGRNLLTQDRLALYKMMKADLKEYREQMRQEFSTMLWGTSGQLPGCSGTALASGQNVETSNSSFGNVGDVRTFQTEFIRRLIEDSMEEVRDDIRRQIQCLHVEMLRQFHTFSKEIHSTMSRYAEMNCELLLQVQRQKDENKRLKKFY